MNGSTPSRHPRVVFAADGDSVRAARSFVVSALTDGQVAADGVATCRLIVSELVSNAIQHGKGPVSVSLDLSDPAWLQLEVTCRGALPVALGDPSQWTIAPADGVSGRGLGIVRSLADEVTATTRGDELSVTCRLRR
jgi:anti-sigma regulatory factor (Ser/Thr protein kinase)